MQMNTDTLRLRRRPPLIGVTASLFLSACATAPLTESGLLSSYADLKPSEGVVTQARLKVDKNVVTQARSVSISPTAVSASVQQAGLSEKQMRLVSNAVDRALCAGLSERFEVRPSGQPADLAVRAVITHLGATDVTTAGVSKVVNIGSTVASAATGVPVPSVRIPLGMGGLSVEAEASTLERRQVAAMTWARGADSLTTQAQLSEEADAYQLAKQFSEDFVTLLVTGSDPLKDQRPSLPTAQEVNEYFGAKPKYAACEQFGSNPGLGGTLGVAIGLPPNWTDSGSKTGGHNE